jgi:predicted  nucleic acid-binding Zn-ribbon protein
MFDCAGSRGAVHERTAGGGKVNNLAAQFAEVEKRVRALAAENGHLRERVRTLEEELGRASEGAREAGDLRARKEQVRDRLKRLLRVLEAMETREKEKGSDLQGSEPGQAGAKE